MALVSSQGRQHLWWLNLESSHTSVPFSLDTEHPIYSEELSMAIQFVFTSVFRLLKRCFYSFAIFHQQHSLCCLGYLSPTADVWNHNSPSDILSHNGHTCSPQPGPQSLVSGSISWSISASPSNDAENLLHSGINVSQYEQHAGRRVNIYFIQQDCPKQLTFHTGLIQWHSSDLAFFRKPYPFLPSPFPPQPRLPPESTRELPCLCSLGILGKGSHTLCTRSLKPVVSESYLFFKKWFQNISTSETLLFLGSFSSASFQELLTQRQD